MKKNKTNILLFILFLVGFSVMLYPSFSDYWNSRVQSRAIASYNHDVQKTDNRTHARLFREADEYNQELLTLQKPFEHYQELEGYEEKLDISGTGIMGYLTIDRIHVELPIYHGTSEGVLQIGVGHLEGSSLPVGGIGTHAVLSAHRGLPSAKLFSNLDELEEGDTFQITVLNRVLTYQVDQLHIIEPDDLEDLKIDPEKDYCTLMTCTPYGVNTHRLVVRGVRVDGDAEVNVPADAYQVSQNIVAVADMIVITIFLLAITLIIRAVKAKKGR